MLLSSCLRLAVLIVSFDIAYSKWTSSDLQPNGKIYHWSSDAKTWNGSKEECLRNGWNLAVVLNSEDYENLHAFVKSQGLTTWIGLYLTGFQPIEGVWSDGSPFVYNQSLDYWADGEPQTFQPCVNIWRKDDVFAWDDFHCNEKRQFVCEARNMLEPADFQKAGENLINYASATSNEKNMRAASNALDQLLKADPEIFQRNKNLSRGVLAAFDDFVGRYQGRDFEERKEKFNIEVRKAGNETMVLGNDESTKSKMMLNLSTELLGEMRLKMGENSTSIQIGSMMYKSGDLFQPDLKKYGEIMLDERNRSFSVETMETSTFGESPHIRLPPRLLSDVISAQIAEILASALPSKMNTTFLDNGVRIQAEVCANSPPPTFPGMKAVSDFSCVFWDTDLNEWSSVGCRTVKVENFSSTCEGKNSSRQSEGKRVTCECNHMTHFAVILDTSYIRNPKYLSYLTIAGCSISAFFLMAATMTILYFRHMRIETNKRIICNISINLFVMNLVFLIGIDRTENPVACKATTFILHYFVLTSWTWMLCEALYLCNVLFLQQFRGDTKLLIAGGIAAYGLPAIGVAITFAVSGDAYLSLRYCWLSSEIKMYAVYAPIGCVLGINVVSLVVAVYAMTCGFKMKHSATRSAMIKQTIRRIIYMIFLLGIPWVFGMLMLLSQHPTVREIFSVLFAVCNMLQGLIIFVAFCATDEKFRKLCRRLIGTVFQPVQTISKRKSFTIQKNPQIPSNGDIGETSLATNETNANSTPQKQKRHPEHCKNPSRMKLGGHQTNERL